MRILGSRYFLDIFTFARNYLIQLPPSNTVYHWLQYYGIFEAVSEHAGVNKALFCYPAQQVTLMLPWNKHRVPDFLIGKAIPLAKSR